MDCEISGNALAGIWVKNHAKAKELMEEISQLHYKKLADRET